MPCALTLTVRTPFTLPPGRSARRPSGTAGITGCCERASAPGASTAPTSRPKTFAGTRTQFSAYLLVMPFLVPSLPQNASGACRYVAPCSTSSSILRPCTVSVPVASPALVTAASNPVVSPSLSNDPR